MKPVPLLTDDAVIELAREGGVAWLPKLAARRRFELAHLAPDERQKVRRLLNQVLPLGAPPGRENRAGRGDQFYYRIQISYLTPRHEGEILLLIPESLAPAELETLWRDGE
ncbi:hypothetical protein FJU30_23600 [Affinibrenneria salicis]|uniref:Uncharacterized protein n=1 Tax=Affinibrenneria salicis TaxID=2590031 RepID=A0A5J5FRF8_9GAMM|nr:protealysin inhibitor emfourin [Affinibrenneria salicis]KAA8995738.1 hypothetical protein FJU30_23600 [Affinibrenneria salicis]